MYYENVLAKESKISYQVTKEWADHQEKCACEGGAIGAKL
jgi:hypothetical protein